MLLSIAARCTSSSASNSARDIMFMVLIGFCSGEVIYHSQFLLLIDHRDCSQQPLALADHLAIGHPIGNPIGELVAQRVCFYLQLAAYVHAGGGHSIMASGLASQSGAGTCGFTCR